MENINSTLNLIDAALSDASDRDDQWELRQDEALRDSEELAEFTLPMHV